MTQGFFVPGPMPNFNDMIDAAKGAGGVGKHYAKMKEIWTTHVWAHAKQARIRPYSQPVRIDFLWCEADQRRDKDNVVAARKFVLDGLVMAGVLKDDGWDYVVGWTDDFVVTKTPGVKLVISQAD